MEDVFVGANSTLSQLKNYPCAGAFEKLLCKTDAIKIKKKLCSIKLYKKQIDRAYVFKNGNDFDDVELKCCRVSASLLGGFV